MAERTGLALTVAPVLLIIAIPVADYFLPGTIHIAPLLTVAPAFTASFAGPRITALIGGLAVVAQFAAGAERHSLDTTQVLLELSALVLLTSLLVLFAYVRERSESRFERTRAISEKAQQAVLRPLPRSAGPLEIATEYRTAESDAYVGGDLFALARTAHSTRLLIGDVRGKGVDSISDASIMLGAFRAAAHRQSPLPELLAYLDGSVRWGLSELAEVEAGERFVTAIVADIPDEEPVVHLVSCGHPPPLLLNGRSARALAVAQPAPPLGLGSLTETSYAPEVFAFPAGHQLLLYTDGVSEARDGSGAFYPLAERAAGAAPGTVRPAVAPREIVDRLTRDLLSYTGHGLEDDMAMIVVRRGMRAPART